jgi:hypothetical protein
VDGRLSRHEDRLTQVEIWKAGFQAREEMREAGESPAPDSPRSRWAAIALAAQVVGGAVAYLVGHGAL